MIYNNAVATAKGHVKSETARLWRRRYLPRLAVVAVLAAAPVLSIAAPAYAITGVTKSGTTLVVNASLNRANFITVSQAGTSFLVSDLGDTIFAGPGCVQEFLTVRCPMAGIARISVNARDLNDVVRNTTATPSTLVGEAGDDTLIGGAGNDSLVGGFGNDTLVGGSGNDTAVALAVRDGADRFVGGSGVDTTSYAARPIAVSVGLDGIANDGSFPEGDNNLTDVENAIGGSANDLLIGNAANNVLNGLAANDTLDGIAGNDTLVGGSGNDTLVGGSGNDTAVALAVRDGADRFFGGSGVDTTSYAARPIAVSVSLDGIANDGSFPEGDNNLTDVERAIGGSANDLLIGNALSNALDTLNGIDGVQGNDVLNGGPNTDRCVADLSDIKIACEL